MVRRSHRRPPDELANRPVAGGRGDDRCGQGLPIAERWQEARDRPGQKRLS
jgi:hypothetical protein